MDADWGAKATFAPTNSGHEAVTFRGIVRRRESFGFICVHLRPSAVFLLYRYG